MSGLTQKLKQQQMKRVWWPQLESQTQKTTLCIKYVFKELFCHLVYYVNYSFTTSLKLDSFWANCPLNCDCYWQWKDQWKDLWERKIFYQMEGSQKSAHWSPHLISSKEMPNFQPSNIALEKKISTVAQSVSKYHYID